MTDPTSPCREWEVATAAPLPSGTSGNWKPQCRAALPQRPGFWARGGPKAGGTRVQVRTQGEGGRGTCTRASGHRRLLHMEAEFSGGLGSPRPPTVPSTLLGALAIAACSRPAASGGGRLPPPPAATPTLGEALAPGEETTAAGGGGTSFSRQYQVPAQVPC